MEQIFEVTLTKMNGKTVMHGRYADKKKATEELSKVVTETPDADYAQLWLEDSQGRRRIAECPAYL